MKEHNERMFSAIRKLVASAGFLLMFIYQAGTGENELYLFVTALLCLGCLMFGLKLVLIKESEAEEIESCSVTYSKGQKVEK